MWKSKSYTMASKRYNVEVEKIHYGVEKVQCGEVEKVHYGVEKVKRSTLLITHV